MTAVRYEASGRRLRLAGVCQAADRDALHEALDTFAHLSGGHLIVDLTAVTDIDPGTARDFVAAARRSRGDGVTVAFVRKHDTPVDAALRAAEQALSSTPAD